MASVQQFFITSITYHFVAAQKLQLAFSLVTLTVNQSAKAKAMKNLTACAKTGHSLEDSVSLAADSL